MKKVMSLETYLEKWQLQQPQLLAETRSSHVYKVSRDDETYVLKLLTEDGQKDETAGAVALKAYGGNGAAHLIDYDEGAHLLEYVSGEGLDQLVIRGEDLEAARIACTVIKKLHANSSEQPDQKNNLVHLKTRYCSLLNKSEDEVEQLLGKEFVKSISLAKELLEDSKDQVILHGDIHHQNILHHPQRGWLAIDPKGLYGERTFDVANLFFNPLGMEDLVINEKRFLDLAEVISSELRLDKRRLIAFAYTYGCLSATWTADDGLHPKNTLELTRIIANHL